MLRQGAQVARRVVVRDSTSNDDSVLDRHDSSLPGSRAYFKDILTEAVACAEPAAAPELNATAPSHVSDIRIDC